MIVKINTNLHILKVWIVIKYFLFEKQTFNGLLKVIGVQNIFMNMLNLF